ncbi:hypothetical protein L6R50_19880 [Myxococcota bacterium]|nr:hypothetical protein [Myxococcota bacterium]
MPTPSAANDTPRRRSAPPWLEAARETWGETFGAKSPRALGAALDDWSELSVDEQTFTIGRLLFLNLLAHRTTQRLLERVVAALEDVADALDEAEGQAGEEDEVAPAPAPADAGGGEPPEPPAAPAASAVAAEPAVEVEVLDPEETTPFDQEDAA